MRGTAVFLTVCLATLVACSSGPPVLPYPSFVQTDDLPDVFMATLPGVRAKRYAEDYSTQTGRYRIDIPADWSGTSGGVPQAALELFVLEGEFFVGDMKLIPGGYAYLPSGSLGFRLSSTQGARILYFLSAEPPSAVIRSPLILDGLQSDWQEIAPGLETRVLRFDPGSGARTWLLRSAVTAVHEWETGTVSREGYLVSGRQTVSECLDGEVQTGSYLPGGYFLRPPNTIYGGGETRTEARSTWFLRELSGGMTAIAGDCIPTTVSE